MSIDWSKLPEKLQKYKKNKPQESLIDLSICNEESLKFLPDHDTRSQAYKIFVHNYNDIQMNANFQTNLYLSEEFHFLASKSDAFGYDIPKEYYEFPSFYNKPVVRGFLETRVDNFDTFLNIISFCKSIGYNMSKDSAEIITKTLNKTKQIQKISIPENIIFENINKNEFLSLFAMFEAFLEDFYIEKQTLLQVKDIEIQNNVNKNLRNYSFKKTVEYVLNSINSELVNLLDVIRKNLLEILGYMGQIRNLHVHHLGIMTEKNLNNGIALGIIKNGFDNITKKSYHYEEILLCGEHKVEVGQYITLTKFVPLFRYYIKEIAFILDCCL